jgi:hypothetical protein
MKAKTLLELVTLSSTLYTISKETHLMEKLTALSEQGKDKINDFMSEKVIDENGNEVQFLDKLELKRVFITLNKRPTENGFVFLDSSALSFVC